MPAGRPPKYETPQDMQRIIDLYFLACKQNQSDGSIKNSHLFDGINEEEQKIMDGIDDVYPTVCGLALQLDLSRQGLIEYADKGEFSDTVKRAKLKVETFLEQRLFSNAAAGTIFNLKNNFGWKDQKELDLSGGLNITNADDLTDDHLAAIAAGGSKKANTKKGSKK